MYVTVLALFAVFLLSVAVTGWLKGKINPVFRIMMFASAVLMFIQGQVWTDIAGVVLGIVAVCIVLISNRKKAIA